MSPGERVAAFNAKVIVGGEVNVVLESGEVLRTRTRSRAQVLATGEPAVWLEGLTGSFTLDVVSPKGRKIKRRVEPQEPIKLVSKGWLFR